MLRNGSRTIKVKKDKLIEQIRINKANHVEEYEKAVKAYKLEALEQLENLANEVHDGALDIRLDLVTPVDNSENYDKILEMFEWEIEDEVELGQSEFRQYVQDENDLTSQAAFANTIYSAKFGNL